MQLSDTAAVVTGGAGGLGEATVRRLAAAGARVVIADLADDRGEKLAADLGDAVRYVRTDVTDEDSVQAAVDAAAGLAPLRSVVVAHGGYGTAARVVNRKLRPAPLDEFRKMSELYLTGTFNVLRLGAAAIGATEPGGDGLRGAVVTTASIAAWEGQVGQAAYSAAKGGVVGLTLVAARDLAPIGVRVVCVAPGTMMTPTMASVGEEALAEFSKAVPLPARLGRPEEYASLVEHVCSNDYINGEVIRLDGAQRMASR